MHLTIQLTSHADTSRGEHERQAEIFTVKLKRNGDARDAFIRDFAAAIQRLAAAHNARFDAQHGS